MTELKQFSNSFEYLVISNEQCKAKIALQGAHLFSFEDQSRKEMIFVSDKCEFTQDKAIRGGIPICWPWFGPSTKDSALPKHGFARTALFDYKVLKDDKDLTQIEFILKHSIESLEIWPYKFELRLIFTLANKLSVDLITKNLDDKDFTVSQALHTYFKISHIKNISVLGLENKNYIDSLLNKEFTQSGPITINEEVDRIYKDSPSEIILLDKKDSVVIQSQSSKSTVVWNPWIDKSSTMNDMAVDSYKTMICIESANVLDDSITVLTNSESVLSVELYCR